MVITIFTVINNVKSRDPIGSKNSPNVVLRVGGDTEVSDGVSCGKPLQVGGLLGGLGGGLGDGLGDVVAGDGLAREGVGELGPRQQLRDGRQLQVEEVNIDLLQYAQYAASAFTHGFSTRNWDTCPQ